MEYMILLTAASEGDAPPPSGSILTMLMPLGLMVLMIYFLFIRPEGKRKKRASAMLSNIQIADEVVTSGGIIGRVIDIKPETDTIVIETGGDKTRIRVLKSCIVENRTIHE
jgi:preprotein translocase subunit YajC